jgi:hypothetical protein
MLKYSKILLAAVLFTAGGALTAAPPEGKGGGKGGGEDPVSQPEPPTTVFIEPQGRKQAPGLFIAGADASNRQLIYQFKSNFTYLHDAVLVSEGHGRALVTDRTSDALPLTLVDFLFDANGVLITMNSQLLLSNRGDWGCEALSSDGKTAIYSPSGSGKLYEITLPSGAPNEIMDFGTVGWFTDCDLNADSGILHVAVYESDTQYMRIDRIDLTTTPNWETVVIPQPSNSIRSFAIAPDGTVAVAQDSGIRIGDSFGNILSSSIVIPDGRMPDFFCDGSRLLVSALSRQRRSMTIYDIDTGSTELYNQSVVTEPQTLC